MSSLSETLFTPSQYHTMIKLQSEMNAAINPQWVQARSPFLPAVVIEAAEAIEHHGWKWWKKQETNLPQLQMELVDIWHFILSYALLETHDNIEKATQLLQKLDVPNESTLILDDITYHFKTLSVVRQLELLIGLAVSNRLSIPLFKSIMHQCQMDSTHLFTQYVNKNILNLFRQANGYKEGTYQKLWAGREDNEHLVEITSTLDPTSPSYRDDLHKQLTLTYQASTV